MAINPMQKKVNNARLIGLLIGLLIGAVAFFIMRAQVTSTWEQLETAEKNAQKVYVFTRDIKSGEEVQMEDLVSVNIEEYTGSGKAKKGVLTNKIMTENLLTPANFNDEEASNSKIIARIDLPKGIVATQTMVTFQDERTTDDMRIEEYNMILLPTDLQKDDFVDIRIMYSTGENYIVLSKKRILKCSETNIFLKMAEEEILTMSNALVESWYSTGSYLYATKYEEAGSQVAATATYPVNHEIMTLINADPNVVQQARGALWKRYSDTQGEAQRQSINKILSGSLEGATEAIESGMKERIQKQQEERSRYISSMGIGTDY